MEASDPIKFSVQPLQEGAFHIWNWKARQANLQPDAQAAWSAISKSQANLKGLRRTHTVHAEHLAL